MNNLVFLDIDGVLNTIGSGDFDSDCVDNLNVLTAATSADIVVSSSWRTFHDFEDLCRVLKDAGVEAKVIDVTPYSKCVMCCRGNEIQRWLDLSVDRSVVGWEAPKNYVILDDCADMLLEHAEHFVRCNPTLGLTDVDARKAIDILRRFSCQTEQK